MPLLPPCFEPQRNGSHQPDEIIANAEMMALVLYASAFIVPPFSRPRHVSPLIFASESIKPTANVAPAAKAVSDILNTEQSMLPATLQFSAFRGYFVVLDNGEEIEIDKERVQVEVGFLMGGRVSFYPDAEVGKPIVTSFVELVPIAEEPLQVDTISDDSEGAGVAEVTKVVVPNPEMDRRSTLASSVVAAALLGGILRGALSGSTGTSEGSASPAERANARKQAADAAAAAQLAAKAKAQREEEVAAREAARQKAMDESAMGKAEAAGSAAEKATAAASWTVQWSIPGNAAYFLNTRTGEVTWVEPREGLLTTKRVAEAKAEAERAAAESSFPELEEYVKLEKLNRASPKAAATSEAAVWLQ